MRRAAMLLLVAACSLPAQADQAWTTVPEGTLAAMRGGFALDDGLMVSFGIVRTVLVDGQVVARTALQIPDVRGITTEQARQLASQGAGLAVVQGGPGNGFQPASPGTGTGPGPGIVIQNTQSNRQLQAITEITATTNTLRMLQGLNTLRTLGDALQGALPR